MIHDSLNHSSKNYFLKVCKKFACYDKSILKNFISDLTPDPQLQIIKTSNLTYFDMYHEGFVIMSDEIQNDTLIITFMIVDIICFAEYIFRIRGLNTSDYGTFCRNPDGIYSKEINKLFTKIDDLLDICNDMYGKNIDMIFDTIEIRTLNSKSMLVHMFYRILHHYHNFHNWNFSDSGNWNSLLKRKKTKGLIVNSALWITGEHETSCEIVNYIMMLRQNKKNIPQIKNFKDYIYCILSNNTIVDEDEEEDEETEEYEENKVDEEDEEDGEMIFKTSHIVIGGSIKIKGTEDKKLKKSIHDINHKLIKLSRPFKVSHYDYMYNLLVNQEVLYENKGKNICATLNNNIEYHVFGLKTKKPKRWFEYYGHNIGIQGKVDDQHMFPMSFDNNLKTFPCIFRTFELVESNNNVFNTMLYFYGKMINQSTGETILGCYEYFINCRGTLFHRFFKVLNKIPDDVVAEIKKTS